jgi:hypothetical protein
MLADTLVLVDNAGVSTNFFKLAPSGATVLRYAEGSTTSAPYHLALGHQATGKGAAAVDRHLGSMRVHLMDVGGLLTPVPLVINYTFAVPRHVVYTPTVIRNAATQLADLFWSPAGASNERIGISADFTRFLNGES